MNCRRFMLINYHLNVIRNASFCRRYVSSLVINSFNKTVLENKSKRKCFDSTKLLKCTTNNNLDPMSYEKLADETLETLNENFEDIVEANVTIPDADVSLNVTKYYVNLI